MRSASRLFFRPPQGTGAFQLKVGYHLLDGKKVALKKPLVVLESHADSSRSESARCFKVGYRCDRVPHMLEP